MIWSIPDDLKEPQNTPVAVLSGHARKVGQVLFHPTADNTLASSGGDLAIKLWDIEKGQEKVEILGNIELINSMTFNQNGNLIATSCRDKHVRIFDVRSGKMTSVFFFFLFFFFLFFFPFSFFFLSYFPLKLFLFCLFFLNIKKPIKINRMLKDMLELKDPVFAGLQEAIASSPLDFPKLLIVNSISMTQRIWLNPL